jgi:hypothetical protein
MQGKLLGIINVDFVAAGELPIIYSVFVKYLRKTGITVKQCLSYLCSGRSLILYNILTEFGVYVKL